MYFIGPKEFTFIRRAVAAYIPCTSGGARRKESVLGKLDEQNSLVGCVATVEEAAPYAAALGKAIPQPTLGSEPQGDSPDGGV